MRTRESVRRSAFGVRRARAAALTLSFVSFVSFVSFAPIVPFVRAERVVSFVRVERVVLAEGRQSAPTRVISLVPALTEMVFAIGAGDKVIAVSSYDDYPPQVTALPKVGALIDPDVERIIALRPDLVLLYGSQTDLMTQLSRASIQYFEYRHGGLVAVTATIRALGQRTGHTSQAKAVAAEIDRRLATLREQSRRLQKPRTLLVFGREGGSLRNIYASGGRGFLHDILEVAGGVNVFADVEAESVQASTEMILTRAPEVIIEIRSTDIPAERARAAEVATWKQLASVPAVRSGRIYLLTGRAIGVPGPRVAEAAELLAAVLHPRP
jgi:iron complex transport system substrate-binding protein